MRKAARPILRTGRFIDWGNDGRCVPQRAGNDRERESCNRREIAGGDLAAPKPRAAATGNCQNPSPDGARTNAQSCGECVSIICWNGARCPYAMPDTSSRQAAAMRGENARWRAPS